MMKKYIRTGDSSYGDIIYNFDGEYVRAGESDYGDIIYNIDGKYVRSGDSRYGDIVYNIDGEYIHSGDSRYGDIVYNIDGEYIRSGDSSYGDIVYNVTSSNNSGGCFVTTACVRAIGAADDCYELETLRKFRDDWVSKHENGEEEINLYYSIAPLIVKKLNNHPDSLKIYKHLYTELVQKCVHLIETGNYEEAYKLYKTTSLKLKEFTDDIQ